MTAIIKGIFTWASEERRSDRYGFITVMRECFNENSTSMASITDMASLALLTNKRACITVKVIETRESGHIGDIFRGIFPSTPDVGQEFSLGVGKLLVKPADWSPIGIEIGLYPDDGREDDWLDPNILYQLHDQTVEITVTEASSDEK